MAAAARICIFIVLAASYDILLGYTGIVSFAHTMFFAIGAYGVAIPLSRGWVGWAPCWSALSAAWCWRWCWPSASACCLRVRRIFFAMITLAVASFAQLLATQLRDLTGGEDGLTFSLPTALSPAFRLLPEPVLGVRIDGRVLTYYLIFAVSPGAVPADAAHGQLRRSAACCRRSAKTNSAPRRWATAPWCIARWRPRLAAAIAAVAGALMALLLRYNGPEATLSFSIMVDILLMVVIGGMGTLYGPALGAAVIVLAQYYLQSGLQALSDATAGLPLLPALFHPDRWLLWLGVLFVLIVYFFPAGIVGSLRRRVVRSG